MALPVDTPLEFERTVADAYRRMPLARKWEMLGETFAFGRSLHAVGLRWRERAWCFLVLGISLLSSMIASQCRQQTAHAELCAVTPQRAAPPRP
jgi:hypothetical protein